MLASSTFLLGQVTEYSFDVLVQIEFKPSAGVSDQEFMHSVTFEAPNSTQTIFPVVNRIQEEEVETFIDRPDSILDIQQDDYIFVWIGNGKYSKLRESLKGFHDLTE